MFPRLPDIPTPRHVPHRRSRTGNRNWLLVSRQRRGPDRAIWERDYYRHHRGMGTAGRISQTHARSAGKNTCREVKVRHRVYCYVRYSKVLDSDVHVAANKKEGVYKTSNYQIPLIRMVGTPGPENAYVWFNVGEGPMLPYRSELWSIKIKITSCLQNCKTEQYSPTPMLQGVLVGVVLPTVIQKLRVTGSTRRGSTAA